MSYPNFKTFFTKNKNMLIPGLILVLIPFTAFVIILIATPHTPSCNHTQRLEAGKCVDNTTRIRGAYQVNNKKEECPDNNRTCLTVSYNFGPANDNYSISRVTAERFGFLKQGELDTKEYYLYIDPTEKVFRAMHRDTIDQMKKEGKLCYSAEEAWGLIGKDACVFFHAAYSVLTNGLIILNEKKEYKTGFTVPLKGNSITWDKFSNEFFYSVDYFAATGTIVRYEGHPEIKVYSSRQLTVAEPYAYSTKYGLVYKSGEKRVE